MSSHRVVGSHRKSICSTFTALCIAVLACAVFVAGLPGNTAIAYGDGAEESPHGALFRRKGWITPAIYQKAPKAATKRKAKARSTAREKAPTKSKQKAKAATKRVAKGKRSSKLRSAARARLPKSRRIKRTAKRRIPARVVKRRERNLKRANRHKLSPKAYAVKVASLGVDLLSIPKPVARKLGLRNPRRSVTGGGRVNWVASSACLPGRLRSAIDHVARNYGRVRVNSTCRSRKHNRRVGGASRSWHLKGRAADIRVFGNIGKAARYLRRVAGGFKHYGGGLFHIDTGPRRSW